MGFTITSIPNPIRVGLETNLTLVRSGGSAWPTDGTPFLSVSGPASALAPQILYFTTDGTNASVTLYSGEAVGVLTLTDTSNNTTQTLGVGFPIKFMPSGTKWFVAGGGCIQPRAPQIAQNGTAGSTTYNYQVMAHNAKGQTTNVIPGIVDKSVVGTTKTGNATLGASNYNIISWNSVVGATGYDVLKWNTGNSTWTAPALNQAGTIYLDKGGAAPLYNLPGGNTTQYGSDAANGLTPATAFKTLSHATSVASPADVIFIGPGAIVETVAVVVPCTLKGAGMNITTIYSAINGTSINQVMELPLVGEVCDLTIQFDQIDNNERFVNPSPSISGNNTDVFLYRVRIQGAGDGWYDNGGSQTTWVDSITLGTYDNFLSATGSAVNLIRHIAQSTFSNGGTSVRGAEMESSFVARDSLIISNYGPTIAAPAAGITSGLSMSGGNSVMINSQIAGYPVDILIGDTSTLTLLNTTYSTSNISAGGTITVVNAIGIITPDSDTEFDGIYPTGTGLSTNASVGGSGFGSIPGYNPPFPNATDLRSGVVVGTTTGTLGVPPASNVLFNYQFGPDANGNQFGTLVPGSGDVATTYSVGSQINASAGQPCSFAFVPDGVLASNTIITVSASPSTGVTGGPFTIPSGDPFVIGAMKFPLARSYVLTFTNNQGLTDPSPLTIVVGGATGAGGIELPLPI